MASSCSSKTSTTLAKSSKSAGISKAQVEKPLHPALHHPPRRRRHRLHHPQQPDRHRLHSLPRLLYVASSHQRGLPASNPDKVMALLSRNHRHRNPPGPCLQSGRRLRPTRSSASTRSTAARSSIPSISASAPIRETASCENSVAASSSPLRSRGSPSATPPAPSSCSAPIPPPHPQRPPSEPKHPLP